MCMNDMNKRVYGFHLIVTSGIEKKNDCDCFLTEIAFSCNVKLPFFQRCKFRSKHSLLGNY